MTAINPNPGASGAIACPACHSAIGEPCVSQLQSNRPVPPMLHPHSARVAGYAPIARAAREAGLDAERAAMQERVARWTSKARHDREISAATAEWLDQAAAATPPPDPEILDRIREAVEVLGRTAESNAQWMIKGATERLEELSPPPPPATTPELLADLAADIADTEAKLREVPRSMTRRREQIAANLASMERLYEKAAQRGGA